VIERLAPRLQHAGAKMQWSAPDDGALAADGLKVTVAAAGSGAHVTFRSAKYADAATLCSYAALLIDPAVTNDTIVAWMAAGMQPGTIIDRIAAASNPRFDLTADAIRALEGRHVEKSVIGAMVTRSGSAMALDHGGRSIADIREDLLRKHEIVQQSTQGLSHVRFRSEADFLALDVLNATSFGANGVVYRVSMLVPADASNVASEALDDVATAMTGSDHVDRTKPARVEATLIYTHDGPLWHLTDANITHIETTK
jgi:hypothetical protein